MKKYTKLMLLTSIFFFMQTYNAKADAVKQLSGLWENQDDPTIFINIKPSGQYNIMRADTSIPTSYNNLKVFHTTDNGLIYAIVRSVKNEYQAKEMTIEEIKETQAEYFYILFDIGEGVQYYNCNGIGYGCIRIFYELCPTYLKDQNIVLSNSDYNLPNSTHWERVQPESGCKYANFFSRSKPEFIYQAPYSGPWDRSWLPWEARANIKKQ